MGRTAWRLLETYGVSSAMAMGLDEVLLNGTSTAETAPTLRLYTWRPESISLGYFQSLEEVPAAANAKDVVRRLTGGGAIHHHGGELTFSLALGVGDHAAYGGTIPDSYERTHGAIIDALRAVGVEGVTMRRDEACASDLTGTGMCFHSSTPQDICWPARGDGEGALLRKGVGTAQRRLRGQTGTGRGRVLHHGSIKVGGSVLEPEVATVLDHAPGATLASVADALKSAFAAAFNALLEPDDPSPDELAQAARLGDRYGSRAFLQERSKRRPSAENRTR